MVSRLEQLLPELLLQVAEYIPRPSDLKALCLACKALQVCALPPLYRSITFDSDNPSWNSRTGKGLLRVDNPGLAYVRNLVITNSEEFSRDFDDETKFLRMLLSVLPRDLLRVFCCRELLLDEQTVFTLLTQQRNIEILGLGPCSFDLARMLRNNSFNWSHLKELDLPSEAGSDDLEAYQDIIEHAPNIHRLISLRCSTETQHPSDKAVMDPQRGFLLRKLFSHVRADDESTKMMIEELEIECIKVWPSMPGLLDLCRLTSLSIVKCRDAIIFISAVAAEFELAEGVCCLRHFGYQSGDSLDSKPVEALLRTFTHLESLNLTSGRTQRDIDEFDLNCLDGHKQTLQYVLIDCCRYRSINGGPSVDLDIGIFASYPKLRYLGIPMPPITIPTSNAQALLEYVTLAQSMVSMPTLKVLRILNLPQAESGTFSQRLEDLNRKSFLHDLDNFFYTNLGVLMSRVPVVIYASPIHTRASDNVARDVNIPPVCYVAEKRTDLYNNIRVSAVRIPWVEAKYLDPEIDHIWSGIDEAYRLDS